MKSIALLLALTRMVTAGKSTALAVGDHVAELHLVDAAAAPAKLADWRGSWLVVVLITSECGPTCVDNFAAWNRVAARVAPKAAFVAIDVSDPDHKDVELSEHLRAKLKPVVAQVLYDRPHEAKLLARYVPEAAPMTYVIDPKGVIRLIKQGFDRKHIDVEAKALENALTDLQATSK